MLTIEVPMLAPAACSPNSRCHWAVKKRAGDAYAQAVYYCALLAKYDYLLVVPFSKAVMSLEFVVNQDRVRDEDNWRTRFKSGQDALVKAGVIQADDLRHLRCEGITFTVDRARAPLTIIRIREENNVET